ncbi:MAG: hypothetical protein OET44_09480 [Gammaproteobacteria bacterium]|nr:hypothetical protein [Gammaproteobacteria bacterium]
MSRLWPFVFAGVFLAGIGSAVSQPEVSHQQLRLLNAQQTLELQQRQHEFRASLNDLAPERRELLQRRLDLQRIDQRQLQQRQVRRQRALRQRLLVAPDRRGAASLSLQLQGFKIQQRQRQLNHTVQRRSWSPLRR